MSYYQDDNSYHYYSEPAYDEDTSNYSYSILNHDNYSPSEPIYYDHDNTLDTVHYADTPLYNELEAYAEAASNRTYTEDEIHPAYHDTLITQATTTIWTCPTPSKMISTPLILNSITRTRSTQPIATTL